MEELYTDVPFVEQSADILGSMEPKTVKNICDRVMSRLVAGNVKPQLDNTEVNKVSKLLERELNEVEYLLTTISTIFLKAASYALKSHNFLNSLEYLSHFSDDGKSALHAAYEGQFQNLLTALKKDSVFPSRLESVDWHLDVTLAQSGLKRTKKPQIIMNLQMADSGYNPSSNLTVEMDEAKLMQLFKTLDTVQRNMDALSQ